MCGIIGFVGQNRKEDNVNLLKECLNLLSHRGPDNKGIYQENNVFIGHARLSIIDLSEKSNQPFVYQEKVVVSFNGEIYNYLIIRKELESSGYSFHSNGDAEVIAAAFLYWGKNFVNRLDGMFAISILDLQKHKFFLYRDVFGKKPLYFSVSEGFCFSSELNPIKKILKKLSTDFEAIHHFLSIGYILHPNTPFNEIKMLPPSSVLEYDISNSKLFISQYFNYADCFRDKTSKNEKDIVEDIQLLLKRAISKRLIGDVPLGIFQSSGLDSTSILSMLSQMGKNDIPCFTIGFSNSAYDESKAARQIAERYHFKSHILNFDSIDLNEFNKYVNNIDFLTFDESGYLLYLLSSEAKKTVKFILAGDGGDEIFGGYTTYNADRYNKKIKRIIPIIKSFGIKKFSDIFFKKINDGVGIVTKLSRFLSGVDIDYQKAHYNWRLVFTDEQVKEFLEEIDGQFVLEKSPFNRYKELYGKVEDLDETDQHLYVDAMTWMTDNNLIKLDRNTMFAGLEARCPFLDKDLVVYLASCPIKLKKDKYLLKRAMQGYLPTSILSKAKTGFNSPVHEWFDVRENEFEFYTKLIYNSKIKGVK